jgi:uncharacterized protein with von Willebrand factor type A (vWA) domain
MDLTDAFNDILEEEKAEEELKQQQLEEAQEAEEELLAMLNIFDEVKKVIIETSETYSSTLLKKHM